MIQQTEQGIELKFETPVNVADLVTRINKELGFTSHVSVDLDLSRHGPRVIVAGNRGLHNSYGYSIILNHAPEQNTPMEDVTSRNLTFPCMVGYDDLKKVHDQLVIQ